MTIKIPVEFTKGENFAAWESGSFNPNTDKGYAILIADSEGNPQTAIFERTPHNSKYHFLIRINTGALAVVTNIEKMPHSNLFNARITVCRIVSLGTRNRQAGGKAVDIVYTTETLWSQSFLSEKPKLITQADDLEVDIVNASDFALKNVRGMIVASMQKALTQSAVQRMFWCEKQKPNLIKNKVETEDAEAVSEAEEQTAESSSADEVHTEETLREAAESSASVLGLMNKNPDNV